MVRTTMPSSTGRQILRKNLRDAQQYIESATESESFNQNEGSENEIKVDTPPANRMFSFAKSPTFGEDEEKDPPRPSRMKGSSLLNDLTNSNSELAHFLLANNKDDEEDEEHPLFNNFMTKSVRNVATRYLTGEDNARDVGSLGTNKAWFYSLALEPMEVRKDRIIMLAEAYAIFGALFLGGTWVLYEWGSSLAYGGCWGGGPGCHPVADRAFEAVMALGMVANLFLAMFASFLWLLSILFSSSHQNWVYGARNLLLLCHFLLTCVLVFTTVGVGLGLYAKFTPHWPELAVTFFFFAAVVGYGMRAVSNICAEEISLEYYHLPNWFKWGVLPFPMLKRGGRQRIRQAAEKRAKELKRRAYQERTLLDPDPASTSRHVSETSIGKLLRRAADAIGRFDFDTSKFEAKLEEDWYNDTRELRSMSTDALSKYMPRRLAEEVHNQLRQLI